MEERERQRLAILEGAVENANEAFVTIDGGHTVLLYNRAAETIFGFPREEVVGKDLGVLLTPRCSRDHRAAVRRYLEGGGAGPIAHETELVATRKNGETFPASISFSVAHIEGRPFFTAVVRDLTEAKALRERAARAERLAELGQIVAEITHDIKNPLLAIGASIHQMTRAAKDEKSLSRLRLILGEVRRLEGLLGEVNDYYLLKRVALEKFDIHLLLQEVCALARQDCAARNILLDCRPSDGRAWVEGDRDKWKQVFFNLLRNGIEALEKGGSLSLHSRVAAGRVEIAVRDDGPGIPPKIRQKIFDPFFSTKQKGTGLGLPICKRIIEFHAGCSIEVLSEEGKGTEVRLTIPRVDPEMGKGLGKEKE